MVEKLGDPSQSCEDFDASIPADECRYVVYDYDFVTEENCQKSRIFFIAWGVRSAFIAAPDLGNSSRNRK
ncbi:unnamed protein product [Linum tenue]|uniref:ADF-H domain-containing protein n=1 Tax=Linum tenue TaxID=586396 RepID=A0AAV0PRY8_9ROSI|nr:unnamed protein product [Linum tenue]